MDRSTRHNPLFNKYLETPTWSKLGVLARHMQRHPNTDQVDWVRGASDEMSAGWLPCPWPSSLPENVFWPSEVPFFLARFSVLTRPTVDRISRTAGAELRPIVWEVAPCQQTPSTFPLPDLKVFGCRPSLFMRRPLAMLVVLWHLGERDFPAGFRGAWLIVRRG